MGKELPDNNASELRFVGQGEEGRGVETVQIRRHQHVVLAPHQGHTSVVPARVSQTGENVLRKHAPP